jgi:hypothetical protein
MLHNTLFSPSLFLFVFCCFFAVSHNQCYSEGVLAHLSYVVKLKVCSIWIAIGVLGV